MMQERWDSFWGHVDDLRQTGLRSLYIIGAGFIFLLAFYDPILQFLISYSLKSLSEGLVKHPVHRFQIVNPTSKEQVLELPQDSLVLSENSLNSGGKYLLLPGEALLYEQPIKKPFLIMGPIDGLILVFKACFWLSIALTAPIWGWVWVKFFLPGMNRNERAVLIPFLLFSLGFVCLGVSLAYFITLPIANEYLSLLNSTLGQNAWTLNNYVNYVLFLCLGHAIAAELGFVLLALVHFRLLSPASHDCRRLYLRSIAHAAGCSHTASFGLSSYRIV
jgi:sec-independent protein translocase protein TatC